MHGICQSLYNNHCIGANHRKINCSKNSQDESACDEEFAFEDYNTAGLSKRIHTNHSTIIFEK